jgi:GT2 family glycosyltransferase
VDVVVVSYNSREHLRSCVEPFVGLPGIRVIVIDNASEDGSLDAVADLPVLALARHNGGFAFGCNAGWREGKAPFVLFLNPDATLDVESLDQLVGVLAADSRVGAVGPKLVSTNGSLILSQRRYPRLRSTYAEALFLHRVWPRAEWVSESVRALGAYERPGAPEWLSGTCLLVRRDALERVGGFDERFFLYCEEIDLCRRLREAGFEIRYEPTAVCYHVGGASAPRPTLLPVLAQSRVRYAQKHFSAGGALLERLGIALNALTHSLFSRGAAVRAGYARALQQVAAPRLGREFGA